MNVPHHYNKMMYEMINSFMGGCPMFHLPHVHDFMALNAMCS